MKVWLVGHEGPEHNFIMKICSSKKIALIEWNKLRLELLKRAKEGLKYCKKGGGFGIEMYLEMIKNLKCTNPEKINNYPQETPFIQGWKVDGDIFDLDNRMLHRRNI